MNFPPFFEKRKQLIDSFINKELHCSDPDINILMESARYSSLEGGKRIRGSICLSIGQIFGSEYSFVPLAAALELIHTYSLIHDDLPVMDDDDYRRGKLANHKVYGEAMAILSGDFLMTKAYQIISQIAFRPENIVRTINYLSKQIGIKGMVGGQVVDIQNAGKKINPETLAKMHSLKSGAFMEAAFITPVVLSTGKTDYGIPHFSLKAIAQNCGLLFQIIDDILDETSSSKKMGKNKGSDKKLNKPTYTSILGLEESQNLAKKIYKETNLMLSHCSDKILTTDLNTLIEFIYNRDH